METKYIINSVDITYTDLYNKIINESLTPGQWYRLTDYKSVNFLNGYDLANNNPTPIDPNFNPREIYTGETEVLLLQAISEYEISQVSYSETFNSDVIQFTPYTNKIGVDIGQISNGQTLPDSSIVSGFDLQWDGTNVYFDMPTGYPALFGHYFYLYCEFSGGTYYQDGLFEPLTPGISLCQYPLSDNITTSRLSVVNSGMTVILLDLTQQDYLNYDANTLYVETIYALGDAYGWITKREDRLRNIRTPFDFRGRKYRRFQVDLSAINPILGTKYLGQGDNFLGQGTTGNYKDSKVFGNDGSVAYDIIWDDLGGPNKNWYAGHNDNVVFFGSCYNNKFGHYFNNNTVIDGFYRNVIGDFFEDNSIYFEFYDNKIGNGFASNTIVNYFNNNIISNDMSNNNIGSFFRYNVINLPFQSNTIGNDMEKNTFNEIFTDNIISSSQFRRNTINSVINSVNFTTATHVYGTYDCQIFRGSNNIDYLSYFDGSSIQYTATTA